VLEDEKQKWRLRFYQTVNKLQQHKIKWQNLTLNEVQAIARPPVDWAASTLSKFTLFRVNMTDQLKDQLSPMLGTGVTIVSIERVENTQLWQRYVQTRETLAKFGTRKSVSVATDSPWIHTQLHIANYVNEVMLWHPLPDELSLSHVINQGFELRLSDLRGTLGAGVYFWESVDALLPEVASKEDHNMAYFVLSRVCLGTPHLTTKPLYGITSPPFSTEDKEKDKEKEKEKEKEKDKEHKDKDKEKEKEKEHKDKDKDKEKEKKEKDEKEKKEKEMK